YPFHPLFGRPAIVVADQLHNGTRHLTLRSGDGPSFLIPAWMVDPAAASVKIVDVPRLSVARLLDLRAFLDSGVASGLGEEIPEGGTDDKVLDGRATGPVRGAARGQRAWGKGAGEGVGAASIAPNGGDSDIGSSARGGRLPRSHLSIWHARLLSMSDSQRPFRSCRTWRASADNTPWP